MLENARKALDEFELSLSKKPLAHKLSEGLDILFEVVSSTDDESIRQKATNIANTYISKVFKFVGTSLENKSIGELELEKLNDILVEVNESAFGKKDEVEPIKNKVITGLIKHYFQGYSKDEQEKIIETITSIET